MLLKAQRRVKKATSAYYGAVGAWLNAGTPKKRQAAKIVMDKVGEELDAARLALYELENSHDIAR